MSVKHTIRHDLGLALARRATAKALETYQQSMAEYDPQGEWLSEDRATVRFTVLGRTLTGQVDVRADAVDLKLDVPLLFRAFQRVAMGVVEKEIQGWLDRARNGELDED